ncbi:MAG: hypothetical protein OIN86_02870 [Candidatus Methanoperedens sp.]|nr:hypothetical protein [Candidatus Methanoperedens sp.]CAG0979769.1 hypothetical protein METP1_01706 [Methanosarcinales archaeon]
MEALEEFGLSKYESSVYLTLLSSGITDARKLSSKSEVPFGRIYDVLSSLESKGLVQKQLSRPKKFLAVEPKLAIKKLLDFKNKEMSSLIQKAGKIEEDLNHFLNKKPKESLFWSVSIGEDTIKSYMEKLEATEKELLSYTELQTVSSLDKNKKVWIDEFLKVTTNLIRKGVKIKLLIGNNDETNLKDLIPLVIPLVIPFMDDLTNMDIRIIPTISNHFDIIDGEKVQLKVRNPVRPEEYFASIFVWQKEFAQELRGKFNELWKDGKEFKIVVK